MNEIPTNRPLEPAEIREAVAKAMLIEAKANNDRVIQLDRLVWPESVGQALGLRNIDLQRFKEQNKDTFSRIANRFLNGLIGTEVLERDWTLHSYQLYRLIEGGEESVTSLTSGESALTLEFVEFLQDPELRQRCGQETIRSGKADTLIREACTILEDRLRRITNPAPKMRRADLPGYAFGGNKPRIRLSNDPAEQEAAMGIYKGILGYFGNRVHHELVDFPAKRARQIVGFADALLAILEEAVKQT